MQPTTAPVANPVTAAMAVQAEGLSVSLSFSLADPAGAELSAADLPAACAELDTVSPAAHLAARAVAAAHPLLLEAFEQLRSSVEVSQALRAEQQLGELRARQSSAGVWIGHQVDASVKPCVHCKHYVPGRKFKGTETAPARCKRPSLGISRVDGRPNTEQCATARARMDLCGEGVYFEPAAGGGQ